MTPPPLGGGPVSNGLAMNGVLLMKLLVCDEQHPLCNCGHFLNTHFSWNSVPQGGLVEQCAPEGVSWNSVPPRGSQWSPVWTFGATQ